VIPQIEPGDEFIMGRPYRLIKRIGRHFLYRGDQGKAYKMGAGPRLVLVGGRNGREIKCRGRMVFLRR